ncbi:dr1-associated corepressor homolog isoform X2 [Daphnia pulex]|uniref:dr1-associated corepressor homolog isoform X2 n=1 Tax=Daphnia pulex TaxID=6669 RepID=UPI001EE10221|nr:dr1-associated corepressor homolog isoform X2 [Daphnia pulex]
MKFVILAALLAVSAASYNNNKAPVNFGSLAYSDSANSAPNYLTSVNSVNTETVYSTPITPVLTYSEVDNVSPVSEPADYETTEAGANEEEEEEEEEHDEENEDDDDEDSESKNESESTDGQNNEDYGDGNVNATSTVGGGEYEHTTASTHVITSAYKEPEYSTTSIPVVVVSTPAYQTPSTTAVPVYEAKDKFLPYWLRQRNY